VRSSASRVRSSALPSPWHPQGPCGGFGLSACRRLGSSRGCSLGLALRLLLGGLPLLGGSSGSLFRCHLFLLLLYDVGEILPDLVNVCLDEGRRMVACRYLEPLEVFEQLF